MTTADPALTIERFDLLALLPGPQHCAACAGRVCEAVRELPGVIEATCDDGSGHIEVTYDPAMLSAEGLRLALEQRAGEEAGAFGHAVYRLTGLD